MEQNTGPELNALMEEQMLKLPLVVQKAITSADMEAHLRALSTKHKLHLDQWEILENEVMLTVLGLESSSNLAENIRVQLEIEPPLANALANDISIEVFEPIRKMLEVSVSENARSPLVEEADPTQLASERAPEVVVPKIVEPPLSKATPTEVTLSHLKSSPDVGIVHEPPAASAEPKAKRGSLDAGTAPAHATMPRQSDPYREPLA